MGERVIRTCSVCDCDIVPNLALGDRQGQPIKIMFAAYTVELALCEEHIKILEPLRNLGPRSYPGAVPWRESLPYLPREEDQRETRTQST